MAGFNDQDFDPLSMNLDSIFRQFKGASFSKIFQQMMFARLKEMHAQIGEIISRLQPDAYSSVDPWQVLGVSREATHEEVKRAWKKKSKEVHPDVGGVNQEQMMVNVAYELICRLKGWSK